jgi:hypothetical protein
MRMPLIGEMVREINAARTSRTLASLITSGVDVLTSLEISEEVVQNSYFKEDLSGKFEKIERFKIIHATSDPIIKGTAVVRAVIEMLKSDGFDFEYIELMNTANNEVMKNLETAHILINQLYSLIPGILTIEALAHRCAVLTSVGERYESFGEGSSGAWISITPGTLYRELLNLFMNPELIKTQAAKGYDWAIANASEETGGKRLRDFLRIN